MLIKKKNLILIILIMFTFILSCCNTTNTSSTSPDTEKVTIVHYTIKGEAKKYINELASDFEKTHSNIKVQVNSVPYENFDSTLKTMISSGNTPDVSSHYGIGGFMEYYNNNMLMDLTDLLKQESVDLKEIGIPDELSKIYTINNKIYGIPLNCYVSLLLTNKNIFDKAGVTYPTTDYENKNWTFDKMLEDAKKMVINSNEPKQKQSGLQWAWSDNDVLPIYFGAKVYSDDTWTNGGHPSACYFDSPEVINAYKRLHDLTYKDKVQFDPLLNEAIADQEKAGDPFTAGKVGMMAAGAWKLVDTEKLPFKIGVAAIPYNKNAISRTIIYVDPLFILKDSKHPKEAFEWIKYMISKEAQIKAIKISNAPPVNRYAYDEYFNSFKGIDSKDMKNVYEGSIKYGTEAYNHLIANYTPIGEVVNNETLKIYSKDANIEEMCKSIQNKVSAIIKNK